MRGASATRLGFRTGRRYAEARAEYERALAVDERPYIMKELVLLLVTCSDREVRDATLGLKLAKRIVEFGPEDANAQAILGVALAGAGEWEKCIKKLRTAFDRAEDVATSWGFFSLAIAHQNLGRTEEAKRWYERGAVWMDENEPDDKQLQRFRVDVQEVLGIQD